MALQFHSIYQTVGDGTSTTFTVPFPYLEKEHVHVFVNGVKVYAPFAPGSGTQVKVEPAPADGAEVLIRRVTPIDEQVVVFQNRSTLNDRSLNRATQQILFAQQELKDAVFSGVYGLNLSGLEGLQGEPASIVDEITQRVTETALYSELQQRISDIDSISNTLLVHTELLDKLDVQTESLTVENQSFAETVIASDLRSNEALEVVRLNEQKVNDNEARIQLEEVARADADTALSGRIDTVESTANSNTSRITTEELARADADSAISARIDTVESTVNSNTARITTEEATRADADTALSQRIDTVETNVSNNTSAIQTESNTRASEDAALAQQINTVFAQSANIFRQPTAPDPASVTINEDDIWIDTDGGNHLYAWDGTQWVDAQDSDISAAFAAIQSEQNARVSADDALAQDINTVQSLANDNASEIQTEKTTRANADSALASDISTLQTQVGNNAAAITSEQTARINGDNALASDISTLQTQVDGNASAIQNEANTRASEDAALAQQINTVAASSANIFRGNTAPSPSTTNINTDDIWVDTSDGNRLHQWDGTQWVDIQDGDIAASLAAIQTEETARINADSALSSRIDTVEATANGNSSAIQTEQTTRANADSALASDISTLQTRVGDAESAIQTEQTTRANADSALASDITTLQTEVDGNTSSIQTQATTLNGLKAQYTVKIDINGRVVGYGLASDGTGDVTNGSSFIINADNFTVIDPDTGEVSIGWDGAQSAFLVNGDLITTGSIQSSKLNISQLSDISTTLGIITAGTFKTSSSSTGYRVEISDSGSYPLWYGTGSKTAANAKFYVDASGNAMFRGDLDVKSASSGARLEVKNNVIKVYDSNGALRVRIGDLNA